MVVMANKIERAHQMYRDGNYEEALGFYTEALSMAKTKPQKIALHSNRAACYLKLHDFKKAAEECTSVLELDHNHTGALMLRAQTLVTLKEYTSALFDVNRLMELNPSSEVYQNLEARLRTQLGNMRPNDVLCYNIVANFTNDLQYKCYAFGRLKKNYFFSLALHGNGKSLAPIPESEVELEEEEEDEHEAEPCGQVEIQDAATALVDINQKNEPCQTTNDAEVSVHKTPDIKKISVESTEKKSEPRTTIAAEVIAQARKKVEPRKTITAEVIAQAQRKAEPRNTAPAEADTRTKESIKQNSNGWQAIPKPKGHSTLDYARWDRVEDDSSEDDDEEEEEDSQPQYRFRTTVRSQDIGTGQGQMRKLCWLYHAKTLKMGILHL
ncbi:hypothetical protein D5086_010418 [Populus alba]|uniref:Uncharacterized protein n=1 Tax=Populus alba TaxID=43335 RepID=A0ACC4C9S9_POPAL